MQALPPVTLGIDLLSDETSLPKGAVRGAQNVEFNRSGGFRRRAGYSLGVSGVGFHSVYTAQQRHTMYACQNLSLGTVSFAPMAFTPSFTLNSADPVEWSEHNGNVFFSNRTTAGWIPSGSTTPRPLGVATPSGPTLAAATVGALLAGTYMAAISLVDERSEESPLSPWAQIKLNAQGGIVFSNLPIISNYTVRLWCSPRDGDVLYLAAEFPAALTQYLLGNFDPRTPADHDLYQQTPPGDFCRAFGARLYTAIGDTLSFSQPYRFGQHSRHTGYVQFNGDITFIEPLEGGIYVGAGSRVWFLAGASPKKAEQKMVSTCRATPHSSQLVPGEHFSEKTIGTSDPVAVWLSTSGFAVGTPSGGVVELQPDRVRVSPAIKTSSLRFILRDGVKSLIATVSNDPTPAGLAVDATP